MPESKSDWVDFTEVKKAVSMKMVLEHYGIELQQKNATSWRGKCPFHVGDSENSFSVNTQKNAWACHVPSCKKARGGKVGGNQLDFVAAKEGCSVRDAALMLQNWFDVDASNEKPADYIPSRERERKPKKEKLVAHKKHEPEEDPSPEVSNDTQGTEPNPPITFALKKIDGAHPYIRQRGLREGTAKHFGVGFFPGKGTMAGRFVIPIHNEMGVLIGYAGRAMDDELAESEGKYKTLFSKSLVVFNLHRVLETGNERREIIVVEGFFDCMKIHQAGFPNVVALMGSELYEHQEELLTKHFDRVVLLLDGDEAGKDAMPEITVQLAKKCFVRVVELPDDVQPDKLSSEEIRQTLAGIVKPI